MDDNDDTNKLPPGHGDTPLAPWVEPALEARIVALVLGEASEFEAAELHSAIAVDPEIQAFYERIKTAHESIQHSESPATPEGSAWKLPTEKRRALLQQFRSNHQPADPSDETTEQQLAQQQLRRQRRFKLERATLISFAAAITLLLGGAAVLNLSMRESAPRMYSENSEGSRRSSLQGGSDYALDFNGTSTGSDGPAIPGIQRDSDKRNSEHSFGLSKNLGDEDYFEKAGRTAKGYKLSVDPGVTGDWDTGISGQTDSAYFNRPESRARDRWTMNSPLADSTDLAEKAVQLGQALATNSRIAIQDEDEEGQSALATNLFSRDATLVDPLSDGLLVQAEDRATIIVADGDTKAESSQIATDPVGLHTLKVFGSAVDGTLAGEGEGRGSARPEAVAAVIAPEKLERVEILREFSYPTEYDPPEIPQVFTSGGTVGVPGESWEFIPPGSDSPVGEHFLTRSGGTPIPAAAIDGLLVPNDGSGADADRSSNSLNNHGPGFAGIVSGGHASSKFSESPSSETSGPKLGATTGGASTFGGGGGAGGGAVADLDHMTGSPASGSIRPPALATPKSGEIAAAETTRFGDFSRLELNQDYSVPNDQNGEGKDALLADQLTWKSQPGAVTFYADSSANESLAKGDKAAPASPEPASGLTLTVPAEISKISPSDPRRASGVDWSGVLNGRANLPSAAEAPASGPSPEDGFSVASDRGGELGDNTKEAKGKREAGAAAREAAQRNTIASAATTTPENANLHQWGGFGGARLSSNDLERNGLASELVDPVESVQQQQLWVKDFIEMPQNRPQDQEISQTGTPANPVAFETRDLGTRLEVEALEARLSLDDSRKKLVTKLPESKAETESFAGSAHQPAILSNLDVAQSPDVLALAENGRGQAPLEELQKSAQAEGEKSSSLRSDLEELNGALLADATANKHLSLDGLDASGRAASEALLFREKEHLLPDYGKNRDENAPATQPGDGTTVRFGAGFSSIEDLANFKDNESLSAFFAPNRVVTRNEQRSPINQISGLENEMKEARTEMLGMMKNSNLIDLSTATPQWMEGSLETGSGSIVMRSKSDASEAKQEIEGLRNTIKTMHDLDGDELIEAAVQLGINNPTLIERYPEYQAATLQEQALLDSGLSPMHPKVLEVQGTSAMLKKELVDAVESTKRALDTKMAIAEQTRQGAEQGSLDEQRRSADYLAAKDRYEAAKAKLSQIRDQAAQQGAKQAKKPVKKPADISLETLTASEPFSTFSLNVSDVSFKLASAALLEQNTFPPAEKVRVEEFVNAFDYGDPPASLDAKVACKIEQAIHPFLQQRNLMRVSMRTAAAGRAANQPLRLTILLDRSGSMEREDREQSVLRTMQALAKHVGPADQITAIAFARQPHLIADRLSGDRAQELVNIVAATPSEGGTNLEEALKLAETLATRQFEAGGTNRIVLITDGAANLGDADPESLKNRIIKLRQQGIAFDACGVGADGLNDATLEALTRKGDGRYYFLNRPEDADANFVRQLAGSLRPAAKNVKVQVKFNPERVTRYRLAGFEKHRLNKEDFRDDKVDAAEMAAAEAGNALYQFEADPQGNGDIGEVFVRFLDTNTNRMVERSWTIHYQPGAPRLAEAAPSMQLAATAGLLAEKLKGGATAEAIILSDLSLITTQLRTNYKQDLSVQQLIQMVEKTRSLTGE